MAKVHVISTSQRNIREADDTAHRDVDSLWGSTSRLRSDVSFYLIILNLILGVLFIIMDVVYYDSCLRGTSPTRTVPAFLFLIGIAQMALSVIIPAFMYFLRNTHLHVMIRIPIYETKKKISVMFAGLVVAVSVICLMLFVILGLSFASNGYSCHSALVLFTQIVCSFYIIGFVILIGLVAFKKSQMPSLSHFSESKKNEYSKSESQSQQQEDLKMEGSPFPDNLSEVRLPDGHQMEDSKPIHMPAKNMKPSAEFMLIRYICVVTGVIWLVSAVPGIPILVLGAIYHGHCYRYRNVPIWLIVHGTMLLFGACALIVGWCGGRGRSTKKRLLYLVPAAILIAFILIWPIVGVAWCDQARTDMAILDINNNNNIDVVTEEEEEEESPADRCGKTFITGVLITSAIYSIPFFILGYIMCIILICLFIVFVVVFIMWSLEEKPE